MNRPEPPDAVAALRVPPHSIEAEQSLIGGLLVDNRAWDHVAHLVTERDFYRHEHRRIWGALAALVVANQPADVITVYDWLQRKAGGADEVGGLPYINQLAQSVISATNSRAYAQIVRQCARLRSLIGICDELATRAFSGSGKGAAVDEVDALVDAAITRLMALQGGQAEAEPQLMAALLPPFIDALTDKWEHNGDAGAVPTGLHDLDRLTSGGMRSGELWVIGARPSMGKTALTLTVSRNTSAAHAVLVLTQEDSASSVVMRQVAAQGRVNLSMLRAPHRADKAAADTMWGSVTAAVDDLAKLRLYIDDTPGLTLMDVRRKVQQVRRRDAELRVVVVDYLQLMEGEGDNRNLELGRIANGMKKLAKEFGLTLVLLSQLNREADKRSGVPQMADLRDSGDIEGAADVIGLLHREFRKKPHETHIKHWAQLHIAKHKNGPTDTLSLWFDGETQRFATWDGPAPTSARYRGESNDE